MKKLAFIFLISMILSTNLLSQTINIPQFPKGTLTISQEGRVVTIPIEIANTNELREFGLMYREDIPEEYGMLFVFPNPGIRGFWMKNTFVELDIAFIDNNGTILNIQNMKPCEESTCPIYIIYKPFKYALEVKAGFFERYGFSEGAKIDWSIDD
ncbi:MULTISPECIES: DUF192 domain-containing protein [Petrotoga]|uniref:DUF192 domain-containing protein n=2 Tax=Petrotoga sibirica TaxID=156202 RepID=A0A4R8EU80_9BACT|nr:MULTISPECIES: DUF192 domain-containing protein [Petrotoga]KUK83959.1 MAG: Uncharacterized protein XD96_0070 [Petrotoga mobilis]POZ89031.1 hypothetical protein AA80_02650 [Petrotoga sibirica DSM 13575]POZ91603.1 hypothetical protein AD60_02390 [Petrotoga sp. SL27]TDX13201.1 hypothetical protein C8D74_11240 [Petrotoga sibirica]